MPPLGLSKNVGISILHCMINTREELILALNEAAELEHALLVQYLFAAFTMKQTLEENLTDLQLEKVRLWKRDILTIAREEMTHFGAVCNLLAAVGSGPRMLRSNLPKRTDYFYALDAPFTLTKFSKETVRRFIIFELPKDAKFEELSRFGFAAPEQGSYNRIGELYEQILNAFKTIPGILIGDPKNQDNNGWGISKRDFDILQPIETLKDVEETINNIVIEGEGSSSSNIDGSHYGKFLKMAEELDKIDFEPSRNVADNPFTRQHRDSDPNFSVNIVTKKETLILCELFNALYNSMLISMMQYYSHSGESQDEKDLLRSISWQAMSGILRPLGEVITKLAAYDDSNDIKAGPSFEIYGNYTIAPTKKNRFRTILERWLDHFEVAKDIVHLDPRLESVKDKIEWMSKKIIDFNSKNSYWIPN